MLDASGPPLFSFRGLFGVPVEVHPSFLLLAAAFVFFDPSVEGALFFGLIALAILLHEFGHAWGALAQGVPVRSVVLWGGGGLCYHAGTRDLGRRELIVAMGPLVNLALWALASLASGWLYGALDAGADWAADGEAWWLAAGYLGLFASINLVLFALNLLPVSPLDGGTLLYCVLRRVATARTAGRIAGGLGVVVSILWLPAMFYAFAAWGLILFFIPSLALHRAIYDGTQMP